MKPSSSGDAKTLSVTVVIPARMASSRYPGKPLASIMGLPLIEHVRRRALMAHGVTVVAVATCDASIQQAVEESGGQAVMTSSSHERCTDRVEEAMQHLPGDIVAMVQGDEPLLMDPSLEAVNLLSPLASPDDYANVDIVKAVCNLAGNVMYFTRAPVPCFRRQTTVPVYRQTGIIAFRTPFLSRMVALPETPLERAESVDMLRALEHGGRVAGVVTPYPMVGVDRPGDVVLVERLLREDEEQRSLFDRLRRA
jgi:3-deoxy-manno-octulosonate cytidylyltransferase (CMP-KDO synthetase)